jgi:hypothetical protein
VAAIQAEAISLWLDGGAGFEDIFCTDFDTAIATGTFILIYGDHGIPYFKLSAVSCQLSDISRRRTQGRIIPRANEFYINY